MAAQGRRNMLTGAGDWEREERLHQQRDYAAQLQEQIRLKQAAAEQEKTRRRHEQQLERDEMVGPSAVLCHCLLQECDPC